MKKYYALIIPLLMIGCGQKKTSEKDIAEEQFVNRDVYYAPVTDSTIILNQKMVDDLEQESVNARNLFRMKPTAENDSSFNSVNSRYVQKKILLSQKFMLCSFVDDADICEYDFILTEQFLSFLLDSMEINMSGASIILKQNEPYLLFVMESENCPEELKQKYFDISFIFSIPDNNNQYSYEFDKNNAPEFYTPKISVREFQRRYNRYSRARYR